MFYVLLLIIVAILFFSFSAYNNLQRSAQRIKETLSNISVSLQKKVNLVNQLIDIVKNYQDGEQLLHLSISNNTTQAADLASSQLEANRTLIGVRGIVQNFPELKANEQYQQLMQSINNIENEVSFQRERYNESVREYNSLRSTIPTVFVANALKFPEAPYLDFSQENIEQTILKDFNTNSGEHLNALLGAAKTNLLEGSKGMVNKALDTGKKIAESDTMQDIKSKSMQTLSSFSSDSASAAKPSTTASTDVDTQSSATQPVTAVETPATTQHAEQPPVTAAPTELEHNQDRAATDTATPTQRD